MEEGRIYIVDSKDGIVIRTRNLSDKEIIRLLEESLCYAVLEKAKEK